MTRYKIKIYLTRLGNAILGKEFTEPRYFWGLSDYILDLIIQFIDKERSGYPISFTEHAWEKKLNGLKIHIENLRDLEDKELEYITEMRFDEYVEQQSKAERRVAKGIKDVFFNLWD